jgi:Glycosyl transferase family 11
MISIFLQAGLGNQFFQLFTAIAYAIEFQETLVIPRFKWDEDKRSPYWDTVFKRLKDAVDAKLNPASLPRYCEEGFHYTALTKKSNVILFGYFQSYKYFNKHSESIIKRLSLRLEQQMIKTKYMTLPQSISLHFRIGDYMNIQLHHPLLQDDYYVVAIQRIMKLTKKDDWDIIYFCEEKDNLPVRQRLFKIKKQFPELTFHKASDEMKDWEQLLLMSCSDHNIIANSSFSWWGAYLNPNPDKIVCYPSTWFGSANAQHDTRDLCPPSWVKI